MTVILRCDFCRAESELEPGEHYMAGHRNHDSSKPVQGWRWISPASFDRSYRVQPETICPACATAIDQAGVAGAEAEKARLKVRF